MIVPSDLSALSEEVARRVIATAVAVAPCLHSLEDDARADAIAILASVGQSLVGDRRDPSIKSKSLGPKRVEYVTGQIGSAFTMDDRAALQGLCRAASAAGSAGPVGSFPEPSGALRRVFPDF